MKKCTKCHIIKCKKDFYGKHAECKECFKKRVKLYAKTHPGIRKKRYRNWRIKRRYYDVIKSSRRQAKLKGHVACTATEEELHNSYTGKCALCEKLEDKLNHSLQADHDHKTGKFRGWLCRPCNSAIGLLKDSPELLNKAIEYLTKPSRS